MMFRSILNAVMSVPLPPRCAGCGEIADDDHRFCANCWAALHFLSGEGCGACGIPMPVADMVCAKCMADPPAHDGVLAAVVYGEIARSLVMRLKYSRRPGIAKTIAKYLVAHAKHHPGAIIVPVPLHRWRIWSRGFNQSALIAGHVAKVTGMEMQIDLLNRVKATPVLRGLGARERQSAVRQAFKLNDKLASVLKGRNVLLVDDVYTSGATTNACAKVLKRGGAASVHVLCWARVIRDDGMEH